MNEYALLITVPIAFAIWFSLGKVGMRKWPAFWLMWCLIMGVAVVAQFLA